MKNYFFSPLTDMKKSGLIRELDSRISNLEHKFDKYDEGDDMSQDF